MTRRNERLRLKDSPPPAPPPEAWKPIIGLARRTKRGLDRFFRIEAASGLVLLAAAGLALVWANSPWARSYAALWHMRVGLHVGSFGFESSLECSSMTC